MRYIPDAEFAEHLKDQGITPPLEGFELDDKEFFECKSHFFSAHKDESAEQIEKRAAYFLIWKDHGQPKEVKGQQAMEQVRLKGVFETLRRMEREVLDKGQAGILATRELSQEVSSQNEAVLTSIHGLGGQVAESSAETVQLLNEGRAAATLEFNSLCDSISRAESSLAENLAELTRRHNQLAVEQHNELVSARAEIVQTLDVVARQVSQGRVETSKQISDAKAELMVEQTFLASTTQKLIKKVAWWGLGLIGLLMILNLFSLKAHAQIDLIQIQQSGVTSKTFAAPFKLNCSTNMTCSISGNVLSLSSSGGAATGYQTIKNAGSAIAQETVLNWTAGIVCSDNAVSSSSDCALKDVTSTSHQWFSAVTSGALVASQPASTDLADFSTTAPATSGQIPIYDTTATNAAGGTGAFVPGDPLVQGVTAHDASASSTKPVLAGGYASAAAPTSVSADGDAVNAWFLRNGAQASVLTAAGALIGGDATNGLDVDVTRVSGTVTVDGSGVTQPVSGTVTANAGTGDFTVVQATGTNLHIVCDSGCGGAASFNDNSAFTFSTTAVNNMGAVVDDTATNTVAENSAGAPRMTTNRILYVDLKNTQANSTAIKVDNSAVTQPISASSLPLPTGAATAAKQPALGTAGSASSDVLTVQGIASMTALKVDGSGVTQPVSGTFWQATQPISAASLPLPTGASTAAKQPALGTAGSASSDVITVQGIASMTALKVDGSAVTQPVSWTVTANAGTGSFTVTQATGTNLHNVLDSGTLTAITNAVTVQQSTAANLKAQIDSSGATAAAVPSRATYIGGSDGTNLVGYYVDPCQRGAKSYAVINQTASAQVITGTASKKTYICSLNIVAGDAENVALVEGTGSVCATSIAGMAGGSTAAAGWNFAANGGMALGNGASSVMATATTANNVCLLESGTGQVSGAISYVQF